MVNTVTAVVRSEEGFKNLNWDIIRELLITLDDIKWYASKDKFIYETKQFCGQLIKAKIVQ